MTMEKRKFSRRPPRTTKRVYVKKKCRFCSDKIETIDYKDIELLQRYITDRGKMVPSRISGNCSRHQRRIAEEIKKARFIALLPFVLA